MTAALVTGLSQRRLRPTSVQALGTAGILAVFLTLPACGTGDQPAAVRASQSRSVHGTGPSRTTSTVEQVTGTGDYVLVQRITAAPGTVTVNVVQYFTGAAARRACAQDGVPGHAGGLCSTFYLRDADPQRVTVPMRRDAVITVLSGRPGRPRRATVAEVAARLDQDALFRLDIAGGAVIRLTEIQAF